MTNAELARVDAAVARANAKLAASHPNPKAKLVVLGMGRESEPKSKVMRRVLSTEEAEAMPPPGLICSARLP
jgi:hypothetical protein